MKKLLLGLLGIVTHLSIWAQTTPAITLTADVDGNPRNFSFIVNTAGTKLNIDWGNGTLVETDIISNDPDAKLQTTTVTGTAVGNGQIKIYGAGITYFEAFSKVAEGKITELNISQCPDLEQLHAYTNSLTSIDLTQNTKLKNINLQANLLQNINLQNNTELLTLNLESNKLTNINLAANSKLTSLRLSNNTLESLDLSSNLQLKTIYLLNCGLTDVNFGNNSTAGLYISLNGNKFTTFDATIIPGLATARGELSIRDNQLTSIKIGTMYRLNVIGNQLKLSDIPTTVTNRINYAPQKAMPIATNINVGEELDLSAQTQLTGVTTTPQTTTFTWYTTTGTTLQAGVDYTENNGKFTFLTAQTDSVYASMTTPAFPLFTGVNAFKTSNMLISATTTGINQINTGSSNSPKRVYTIDGRYVGTNWEALPKGVYVVEGKKITKF